MRYRNFKSDNRLFFLLLIFFLSSAATNATPLYEFRGVWVATVTNIDWPSRQGLDVTSLKKEVRAILDQHQRLGMNAIILQVRPAGDAMYASTLEPWSKYLTGHQGIAPAQQFDPLQYWIEESHKRGLEFHAWINPFRAALRSDDQLHELHPAIVNPHWTIDHDNRLYYNPGINEVHNHIINVIADLVTRYDIDGLHMDDYFYPYPVRGMVFNDSISYLENLDFEAPLNIHDWRRENINRFIKNTADKIKEIKPWVKFGISPFGVWRNIDMDVRGSNSRAGVTCYDHLYADVLKWHDEGWVDYFVPQIYWSTKDEAANFTILTDWWNNKIYKRHLYVGHGIYKINGNQAHWDNPHEVTEQIKITRTKDSVLGSVFFSHKHFNRNNNGLNYILERELYIKPALTPSMNWLMDVNPPNINNVNYRRGTITWDADNEDNKAGKPTRYIIFYTPSSGGEELWALTTNKFFRPENLSSGNKTRYDVQVASLDRLNNMSQRSEIIRVRF